MHRALLYRVRWKRTKGVFASRHSVVARRRGFSVSIKAEIEADPIWSATWSVPCSILAALQERRPGRLPDMTTDRPPMPTGEGSAGSSPDRPPGEVVEQAKEAFAPPAGALLPLVFDSLVDSRSEPEDHWLRFEGEGMVLRLDLSARPEGTEISGHVQPAVPRVALHLRGTELALVAAAGSGSFDFSPVPHGLVRLTLERDEPEPPVWTEWVRV